MSLSQTSHRITGPILTIVWASLTLAGCQAGAPRVSDSASIVDLDKDLVALYREKLAAPVDAQSASNSKLADLATRSASQGDAAVSDPPSAVSFYRIAATAAWAAGPPHDSRVPDLKDRGAAACGRLAKGDASQPRDCAVLKISPNLALLEVTADDVQKLRDAGSVPPASFDNAVRLSEIVSSQIVQIMGSRPAGSTHAPLDNYLQPNLRNSYCMLAGLAGDFLKSSPPPALSARVIKAGEDAQRVLDKASFPTNC